MQNKQRFNQIKHFLSKVVGLKKYQVASMGIDASSRKYFRVILQDGTTRVLVDDKGGYNRPKEFVLLSKFLLKNGIRAPKVLANSLRLGLMLVEDFGETDFVKMADGMNDKELLRKAVDVLIKLHQVKELPETVGEMDEQVILDNFALFSDWYMPACLRSPLTKSQRESFFAIVKKMMPDALKLPKTLVLWDYHVNNVMYPKDSHEAAIIDFQDALKGPGLYDLASLIEDERRQIDSDVTDEMKNYYFSQMQNLNRHDFEVAYAYMALLRHMRVLGRFTTLMLVKKRRHYAQYIPHALELLKRSLENPLFAELKQWLDENFAESQRGIPLDKEVKRAFILAAGRGSRMGKLTEKCPKPLVKVKQKPLIGYAIDLLKRANIKDVTVNVCYRKNMVKKYLSKIKGFDFRISEEKKALETGGGIKKALKNFVGKPFVVVNADNILLDNGYKSILHQMFDVWDAQKYDIMLLLKENKDIEAGKPEVGNYKIEDGKLVRNKDKLRSADFAYCYLGVAIVHPRIFEGVTKRKFSLRDLFDKAQEFGRLGYYLSDRREFLVDSPQAVEEAENKLKQEK